MECTILEWFTRTPSNLTLSQFWKKTQSEKMIRIPFNNRYLWATHSNFPQNASQQDRTQMRTRSWRKRIWLSNRNTKILRKRIDFLRASWILKKHSLAYSISNYWKYWKISELMETISLSLITWTVVKLQT